MNSCCMLRPLMLLRPEVVVALACCMLQTFIVQLAQARACSCSSLRPFPLHLAPIPVRFLALLYSNRSKMILMNFAENVLMLCSRLPMNTVPLSRSCRALQVGGCSFLDVCACACHESARILPLVATILPFPPL